MKMNQNTLLALMLLSYFAPIIYIYYISSSSSGAGTRSISSIITSKEPLFTTAAATATAASYADVFQTRHFIAASMFLMAIFTLLYEYQRCLKSRIWSLAFIVVILLGIFGVIYIPEDDPKHYIFAAAVFFAIIGFMVGHTYYGCGAADDATISDNLRIILYAQFLFMVVTVIGVLQDAPIFAVEVLFLMNFAVFYLYIHANHTCCSASTSACSDSQRIADAVSLASSSSSSSNI
jgi:hypothetical protein